MMPLAMLAACSPDADDADAPAADPVALVRLAPVTRGPAQTDMTLYGSAEAGPAGKLSLVAPAETKVVAILAPAGSSVRQGEVVVRLEPSPQGRADAAKASSDAAAADKALSRAIRLRGDGLMSDADVETARAAATAADALRQSFASRSAGLVVRAPAAGAVDAIAVAVGDLLQPGAAVASVTRGGDLRVRFGIDPDSAQAVHPGTSLTIAASAVRASVSVPVETVNANVDPQTRLASVYARVPARSGIRVGETLTARVEAATTGEAITLPYAALLDDGGQPYVFVVTGGVAHRHDVASAPSSGARVAVTKGVRVGDSVVVEGATALEDGMKVRTR